MDAVDSDVQIRALIRRPASYLDPPEWRDLGYVEEWSRPGDSKRSVCRDSTLLSRSDETHAWVVSWQVRGVIYGEWRPA